MEKEQLSSDIRKAMFEIITQKENHEVTVIEYIILLSEQCEFVPTVKAERLYEKDGLVKI